MKSRYLVDIHNEGERDLAAIEVQIAVKLVSRLKSL